jgi:hypothetical protein
MDSAWSDETNADGKRGKEKKENKEQLGAAVD